MLSHHSHCLSCRPAWDLRRNNSLDRGSRLEHELDPAVRKVRAPVCAHVHRHLLSLPQNRRQARDQARGHHPHSITCHDIGAEPALQSACT